jgi:UDP-glucose 4-epimerase
MILVTGGLGFIGSHTTRALLDLGEECVVTWHRASEVPEFLRAELGTRLVAEPLELEDDATLARLGERHAITGIVHLADAAVSRLWRLPGDATPLGLSGLFDGLGHILEAAARWGVSRVTVASTIGVYGGVAEGVWSEEMALPPVGFHAIPTVKKCNELLAGFVAGQLGLDVVNVRPSFIWGPRGRERSTFHPLPALVHAAVRGSSAGAAMSTRVYADHGYDVCYVKDCGRAIALVQTAPRLCHTIYNVGSGRVITNAEVVGAIRAHVPDFDVALAGGRDESAPVTDPVLDLTRIQRDTGYAPAYDIEAAVGDYVAWLRAGHDR